MPDIPLPTPNVQDIFSFGFQKNLNKVPQNQIQTEDTGYINPAAVAHDHDGSNSRFINPPTYSYKPTWASTGTQPALVNGSTNCVWSPAGKFAVVHFGITFSSATQFGSGDWIFGLPVTAAGARSSVGISRAIQMGTQELNALTVHLVDLNTFKIVKADGSALSATVPWSWASATTDSVSATFMYEMAFVGQNISTVN